MMERIMHFYVMKGSLHKGCLKCCDDIMAQS